MNGQLMAAEIRQQPAVYERIMREGRPAISAVAEAIRRRGPRFALLVARGSSDHAALYAKYLMEIRLGWPAGLASPSTMTVYDAHPDLRDVLVVAVSQSGGSPDLLEPIVRARRSGAVTLALTNAPQSPLAEAAEFHIDILAGSEQAVAATKSYTAELLTFFCLVEALSDRDGREAEPLAERAQSTLDRQDEIVDLAARYHAADQLVTTARGYNYATARETALKLMETSYIVAQPFSGADLLHGPMAMIDRGFPIIAAIPEGPGGEAMRPVLERLQAVGADTLVVGDPGLARLATVALPLPDLGPEHLTPLLLILPLQELARLLALERGSDPDQPRGLRKVTETW